MKTALALSILLLIGSAPRAMAAENCKIRVTTMGNSNGLKRERNLTDFAEALLEENKPHLKYEVVHSDLDIRSEDPEWAEAPYWLKIEVFTGSTGGNGDSFQYKFHLMEHKPGTSSFDDTSIASEENVVSTPFLMSIEKKASLRLTDFVEALSPCAAKSDAAK